MTELAQKVFNEMIPLASEKKVYRIYHGDKILKMHSGKYQWTSIGAAKNALHNHIQDILYRVIPSSYWKEEDNVYNEIMKEIEIREC